MSHTDQAATERSTTHATFVIERIYDASPQRVFDAWADPAAKAQWFGPSDKRDYSLEFRVGGREHLTVQAPDGAIYNLDAVYQDIVPGRRIIHAYDMHREDVRISVSLATIEIEAHGDGARLTLTEHGVYLDGHDTPEQRQHGTNEMSDALAAYLLESAQAGL
ncbi:MAG: SRPBCC family protein [Solirubrobacteraceae bacterium]